MSDELIMQLGLGLFYMAVGLLSLWQGYRVLCERDSLWIETEKFLRSQGLLPQRTEDWDREQLTQAPWWIIGGLSAVVFSVWLLI